MADHYLQPIPERPIAPRPARDTASCNNCDHTSPSRVLKARLYTAQEWQAMYGVIRQLYVFDHRKLSEVMVILDHCYGFKATEQMYKKRFAAWGLAKNRRRIPTKTTHPAGQAGRQVAQRDVACMNETWRSSAIGRDPTQRSPAEGALYSIAAWANGTFDGTRWLQTNPQLKIHNSNGPVTYMSTQMYQDMAMSKALLARRQGHLAGMAVRKAFWKLDDVLKVGDPGMMRNLVDMVLQMVQLQQGELLRMLLRQLASLAAQGLPSLHPLIQYFSQLAKNEGELVDVIRRTYRCFVEQFHMRMDDSFYWMYDNWVWDSSVRAIDTDPESDYKHLTEALQTLALNTAVVETAPVVSRSHLGLLKYTKLMRSEGFHRTSAAGILKTLEEEEGDTETIPDPRVRTYKKTASLKRAVERKDWHVAREIMRANVNSLETNYGHDSREVIRELWSLEKVMRKAGSNEEADQIAKDALGRVVKYLSEVPGYM